MLIKKPDEIEQIKKGGKILGQVLEEVISVAKSGVTTLELDQLAEKRIKELGGVPSFKGYRSFPGTICASVNDEVVHGIPGSRVLKDGDVLGIDLGMKWPAENGFYTDTAATLAIGEIKKEHQELMERTQQGLYKGIKAAQPGNSIADIGRAVENHIKQFGYGIVVALVGHGVGYQVHEDPRIPNVYKEKNEAVKIEPGMVLAIEPMITLGSAEIETADDGWTVVTKDKTYAAHFEHTIVIEENGNFITTQRPSEKI